jgi:hypothetical protein
MSNYPYRGHYYDRKRPAAIQQELNAPKRPNTNPSNEVQAPIKLVSIDKGLVKELMSKGHIDNISEQAFKRRSGWDDKMIAAAERTKAIVTQAVTNRATEESQWESDGLGYDSPPCGVNQGAGNTRGIKLVCQFIDALPGCLLLDMGFHIHCNCNSSGK